MSLVAEIWSVYGTTLLGICPVVSRVTHRENINAAGTVSASFPAYHPSMQHISMRSHIKFYNEERGARNLLCTCIVDSDEARIEPNGSVSIKGADLAGEFNDILVNGLEISERVFDYPDSVHTLEYDETTWDTWSNTLDGDPDTYNVFSDSTEKFIYFFCVEKIDQIALVISTTGGQYNTVTTRSIDMQYFNKRYGGWLSFASVTDGTIGSGATMNHSGTIDFSGNDTEFERWEPISNLGRHGYWCRIIMTGTGTMDPVYVSSVTVNRHTATSNDVSAVVALMSSYGWTQDTGTGYYSNTTNGSYLTFADETVLLALNVLAERANENFRFDTQNKRVQWLRSGSPDASVKLVGSQYVDSNAVASNELVGIITQAPVRRRDMRELYTWSYPRGGAGDWFAAQTIAETSYVSADFPGFNIAPESGHIKNNTAATSYGKIERSPRFPDVNDYSGQHTKAAADELVRVAIADLERNATPLISYLLPEVTNIRPGAIRPGDKVKVYYNELYDSGFVYAVPDLYVTKIQTMVDNSGAVLISIEAGNRLQEPKTEETMQVASAIMTKRTQAQSRQTYATSIQGIQYNKTSDG